MRDGRYESVRNIGPSKEELAQHRWPLEVGALWLQGLMLRFCPFWWFIDGRETEDGARDGARVAWVLGWLILLVVIWAINPAGSLKLVFGILALLRLMEIFTTGLGTILDRKQQAHARSLITISVYAFQISFIFAILEHSFAGSGFTDGSTHASNAFDFLYISWTDMTTLGNSIFDPQSTVARIIQMVTGASGMFLFGVLVAFGIHQIPKELIEDEEELASKKKRS